MYSVDVEPKDSRERPVAASRGRSLAADQERDKMSQEEEPTVIRCRGDGGRRLAALSDTEKFDAEGRAAAWISACKYQDNGR